MNQDAKLLQLFDSEGRPRYWWSVILAVPPDQDGWPYRRLRRAWFDHTWSGLPFLNFKSELHMCTALFENFAIYPPQSWVPELAQRAGLNLQLSDVREVRWGYEVQGSSEDKYADVAVHLRDRDGDAVILVEAKKKGGEFKDFDKDPSGYLDLDAFRWADRRGLIYLIDESDRRKAAAEINDPSRRSGILTWQELGGLQVDLAASLEVDDTLQCFVAGAIQYQFSRLDIFPTQLVRPYLAEEPPREAINKSNPAKMRNDEFLSQDWRLPDIGNP